ncbi:MAG: N-acetylmuramoyl-L-alanine amidase [Thermomicrobiaceae bacterium]|nr:N-acetylmuramoyl-L-alanine amidase [Thermomicrobiaceae bacterium]
MHLTDLQGVRQFGGKGEATSRFGTVDATAPELHTLRTAASLLGLDPDTLKRDPLQNLRGGAALLARYAEETTGGTPASLADWYGAVAKYSGSRERAVALDFAEVVFATINQGVSRTTFEGQTVRLAATRVQPNRGTASALALRETASTCPNAPAGVSCEYIPAAYVLNNPDDLGDYGNYDLANREADGLDIRYIVIHDTEGSYQSAINIFQNPHSYVSAHFVIRSADGHIAQMVNAKDVAWQAGNWYVNCHSIGIEHEGFALEGATWYNEHLYRASARLVRYLARQYDIPLDRAHIIGHDDVPGPTAGTQAGMHWDPGPYWDWAHFMRLLGAPVGFERAKPDQRIVTIAPNFETNQPAITYNGAEQPAQSANFVYLHTAPSFDAPLITNPALPRSGTTDAADWSDKAVTGQQFVKVETQGDWTAIWFSGQKAWFHNPKGRNAAPGSGTLVTPKAGLDAIPVYGRAYPEASAYPEGLSPQPVSPLQYTIPAGQVYVAKELVTADYYWAPTYTLDPSDHKVVKGQDRYYQIFFNHRFAYVRASDVDVVP